MCTLSKLVKSVQNHEFAWFYRIYPSWLWYYWFLSFILILHVKYKLTHKSYDFTSCNIFKAYVSAHNLVGYKFVQMYMFLFEFFHLSYLKMGYMFSLKNILFSYTIIGFEPNNIYVLIILFVLKIF